MGRGNYNQKHGKKKFQPKKTISTLYNDAKKRKIVHKEEVLPKKFRVSN